MKIYFCTRCKIIKLNEFCSNCLNNLEAKEIDPNELDIRAIEYINIDNKTVGFVEVSYKGASIRVFGEIERLSDRLKVKEWGKRFVFTSIT